MSLVLKLLAIWEFCFPKRRVRLVAGVFSLGYEGSRMELSGRLGKYWNSVILESKPMRNDTASPSLLPRTLWSLLTQEREKAAYRE